MKLTALNSIDWYKVSHKDQYPKNTTHVYSNLTPRSNKHSKSIIDDGIKKIYVWGLNGFMQWYLKDLWDETFFNRPKEEVVAEYKQLVDLSVGGDNDVSHIEELHDLGYLPILIKSIKEGFTIDISNGEKIPLYTIINTKPKFFWLTNYLETVMSSDLWKPITVASIAKVYKEICLNYSELTCDNNGHVPFQCHDFSSRGLSGMHDSAVVGAAHLQHFAGTDNVLGIEYLRNYYGIPYGTTGFSIRSTEHATTTTQIQTRIKYKEFKLRLLDAEIDYLKDFLTKIYPEGMVGYVADSYDFWGLLERGLPEIKDLILDRKGKLVLRPDSSDPHDVICGSWKVIPERDFENIEEGNIKSYLNRLRYFVVSHIEDPLSNKYARVNEHGLTELLISYNDKLYVTKWSYEPPEDDFEEGSASFWEDIEEYNPMDYPIETVGAVEYLYGLFGGTLNNKGYKLLDEHIGLIYGDSITPRLAEEILKSLKLKGYASSNVVFGVGSYSYQYITRDTLGMAVKATYACLNNNDEIFVYKDPKTDQGKKSSCGLMAVKEAKVLNKELREVRAELIDNLKRKEYAITPSMLNTVYLNGLILTQPDIVIYGRDKCKYCNLAKELLERLGLDHAYINYELAGLNKEQLSRIAGAEVETVPVIVIDGDYVGGYNELLAYLKLDDSLEYLI